MTSKDFYNKELKEDETIGSVELMEKYAKHVIEMNFCNGSPIEFSELTVNDLKIMNDKVNYLVDWCNE